MAGKENGEINTLVHWTAHLRLRLVKLLGWSTEAFTRHLTHAVLDLGVLIETVKMRALLSSKHSLPPTNQVQHKLNPDTGEGTLGGR